MVSKTKRSQAKPRNVHLTSGKVTNANKIVCSLTRLSETASYAHLDELAHLISVAVLAGKDSIAALESAHLGRGKK